MKMPSCGFSIIPHINKGYRIGFGFIGYRLKAEDWFMFKKFIGN